jgi:hypothetical protein
MVLIGDIEVFEKTAKELLRATPKKTRLSTKFRRLGGPVFTMKVSDGRVCYKIKITKEQGVRAAQKVISALMHMMTSSELLQ